MTETPPAAPQQPRVVVDLGPIRDLVAAVRDRIENIWGSLTDLAQQFSDALRSMIEGLLPSALQALAGAVTAFSTLTSGLLENLTTSSDLWQSLLDTFGADLTTRLPKLFGERWGEVVGHALDREHSPVDPEQVRSGWQDMAPPARAVLNVAAGIAASIAYLQAASAGGIESYRQASMIESQPAALSPAELAAMAVQNVVAPEFAKDHAKRSGLTPELMELLITLNGEPPAAMTMLELWRRHIVEETDVDQAIRESRLKNKYIEAVKQLRYVLPSPGDLIRFLVRDVFDESVVADFGLDADFEAKYQAELFDQVGLSRQLALDFWRAHWQLPAIGQLFEMHHRTSSEASEHSESVTLSDGSTVHRLLNMTTLQRMLGINDVLPMFRDKLTAVAFNPLTRVDVRRMHQIGALDHAGVMRAYLDLGYTSENAQRLADFSQLLVDRASEAAKRKQAKPMIDRLLASYRDAVLSKTDATQLLLELGATSTEVEAWLSAEDVRRAQARADAIRNGVRDLYLNAFIDQDGVKQRLEAAGIGQAEAEHLLTSWSTELEYRVDRTAKQHLKDLSRAEIVEAYADRIVERSEAAARLGVLGYDAAESETLLALSDARAERQLERERVAAVQTQYTAGRISWEDAEQRLRQLGESNERIGWLRQRWDVERDKRTPDVPLGTLEYLVREQLTSEDDVRAELLRRGYSEREADWLLASWRQRVAVSQQQLELQRQRLAQQQSQFEARQGQQQQLSNARLQAQLEIASRRLASSADLQAQRLDSQAQQQERSIASRQELQAKAQQASADLQQQRLAVQQRLAGETNAIARDRLQQQVALLDRRIAAQQTAAQQHQEDQVTLVTLRDRLSQAAEQRRATAQLARDQAAEQLRIAREQRAQVAQIATEQRKEQTQVRQTARQVGAQVTLQAVRASQQQALAAAQAQSLGQWQQQLAALVSNLVQELVTRIQPPPV